VKNRTRKWIRAGVETLIHGGSAAIASSLIAASIDSKDWGLLTANFFKMLSGTFMTAGGIRFFQWWSNNPLPPDDDTGLIDKSGNPLLPVPQISINPLSKVVPVAPNGIPKP
jgi:hypothetical protein